MSESEVVHIGQKRAEFAFELVQKVGKEQAKEYASHVKRFPMIIKTNGLTYAVSFAYSKAKIGQSGGDKAWALVYHHIKEWLSQNTHDILGGKMGADPKPKQLMSALTKLKHDELMWVTTEVIEFFNWLKRFAHGEEQKPKQEQSDLEEE